MLPCLFHRALGGFCFGFLGSTVILEGKLKHRLPDFRVRVLRAFVPCFTDALLGREGLSKVNRGHFRRVPVPVAPPAICCGTGGSWDGFAFLSVLGYFLSLSIYLSCSHREP